MSGRHLLSCYLCAAARSDHSVLICVRAHSEGGSSLFQLTLQKNLNATHRMEGIFNHNSIKLTEAEHKNVSVY